LQTKHTIKLFSQPTQQRLLKFPGVVTVDNKNI